MTLYRKMIWIIGIAFACAILVMYLVSRTIMLNGFDVMEREGAYKDINRALSTLDYNLADLNRTVGDWAAWDDTYSFIEMRDYEYIKGNLPDQTFVELKIDLIVYINQANEIVYIRGYDYRNAKDAPVSQGFNKHITAGSPLIKHDSDGNGVTGIIELPEGPMLVASRPILNSERQGLARGTLIMGRYLDAHVVEDIAKTTNLSFQINSLQDLGQLKDELITADDLKLIKPVDKNYLVGYSLLKDIYGKPILALRATFPREIYQQGLFMIKYQVILLTTIGFIFGLLMLLLIVKIVLSRLADLSSEVETIGRKGDFSARVLVKGEDELSTLADSVNGMLEALDVSKEEIRRSEEKYRRIVEAANEGIWILDADNITVFVNQKMAEMLGYTVDEMMRASLYDFMFSEDIPAAKTRLEQRRQGKNGQYDIKYRRKNGTVLWVIVSTNYILDQTGKFAGSIGMITDITERKLSEEILKRYELLYQRTRDIILFVRRDGKIVEANQSAVNAYGYSREELLKLNITDLRPMDAPAVVEGQMARAESEGILFETYHRRKDGSTFPVEVSSQGTTFSNERVLLSIIRDITTRKTAEEALRESQQRLADIINFLPDAVFVIDLEGKVISWNKAAEEMTGVKSEEIIGKGNYEYALPLYGKRLPVLIDLVFKTDQELERDFPHVEKKGKTLFGESFCPAIGESGAYLRATAAPLFDSSGRVVGAIESLRDVTEKRKTEEELIRIKKAIESSSNAIWMTDSLGEKIIYYNESFSRLFKYTGEEINERGGMVTLYGDPDLAKTVYTSLIGGNSWSNEIKLLSGDGVCFPVSFYADMVQDEAGNTIALVGIASDITVQKQTESALIESRQRMADIIDFLPDATMVIDNEGKVIAWNRAMEEMTGVNQGDMLGKGDYEYSIPFHGERVPILIDLVLKSDESIEKNYKFIQRDRGVLIAETPLNIKGKEAVIWGKANILYDTKGNIVGAIESIRDVTERKRAEAALAEEKERLAVTLRSIGDGVITADIEGKIMTINKVAEEITGWTQGEVEGKPLDEVYQITESKISSKKIEQTDVTNKILLTKGGNSKIITDSASIIRDEIGNSIGYVLVFKDITEHKRLEAQIALSQKMEAIGQLAAGIAHEINTPLQYVGDNTRFLEGAFKDICTLIEMYHRLTQDVEDKQLNDELMIIQEKEKQTDIEYLLGEIPEAINQSMDGLKRVSQIVLAMKDFSHPGKEKSYSDLNRAIEGTITISRNEWKYVAELVTDLDPQLNRVYCVIDEINQVLLNMIINSAHAIMESLEKKIINKGRIAVSTRTIGNNVEIKIKDNGIGIPEEITNKIYDPFFTTKEVGKGTGQGLALAHDIIVNKHNGYIQVESTVGQGTCFTIYLPISETEA
ncbi:MAG: PAS domain S-box protein [Firmicutes bacterium]|nr:PAS domain S-box protein [Bacillota bacterium]